jgi:F-type H+-transporting ATPase subunit alpha
VLVVLHRELAAFSQFASDLDDATREQLEHGERVMELMKQHQYAPLSVAEMAISLFSAEKGFLKDIELNKVLDFEAALHSYMNNEQTELMNSINETGNYNDDIESQLKKAFETFKSTQTW